METIDGEKTFNPNSPQEWRDWLKQNGKTEKVIWAILRAKGSRVMGVHYIVALSDALFYGWVDNNKPRYYDRDNLAYRFAPRKPRSKWSKTHIEMANKMMAKGLMSPQGMEAIELAKSEGVVFDDQ